MSGPGSRREKLGSIFTRLTGLLRSGAVKEEDRPIWYDIVKALPPKPVPPTKDIPNILYPEDYIRVHFYQKFAVPTATVLTDEKIKSVPQKFVDKYLQLQSEKALPASEIFDETVNRLREEGVELLTNQEYQANKEKASRARLADMEKANTERSSRESEATPQTGDSTGPQPSLARNS